MIKIAFETLSNEDKKQTYLKEIRQMGAQKLLIADSLIEQGQKLLSTGQAKMALQKFTEAFEIDKTNPDILAYLAWAKLKLLKSIYKWLG